MIILIDQDGPLADFEGGFIDRWQALFPKEPFIPFDQRKSFYIRDDYPSRLREKVASVYLVPGFCFNLKPVPGSIDAVKSILELGHDVRICTSPLSRYENCVLEKFQWVEKHLGYDFTKKIIFAKDKTLIRGHFLIDDRPNIEGVIDPEWEHILFDCPYNWDVINKRRLNWNNWQEVLNL